ncbi:hypothetical protein B5F40_02100 [Gordonibacter sp. An230]|uniref:response regulator transcription factor n=1 Tax=Gordonibacter sp. An230 TaxID=1965592 RepID=UPI000B37C673|nr:LuxR family transcriptional regulator [Gordonibacter sp. An230]OUO92142.1 hypothetical protein B5F40_02100 [Gordonibacter sp. An230]
MVVRTASKLRGIDRIAALMEPSFPMRMLGFGLIYAWSTCLWDIPLFSSFNDGQPLQTDTVWALSAAITPLACVAASLVGRTRELSTFPSLYVAGPVLTAVGTVFAVAHPFLTGLAQDAAYLLAGMGTGIGPVILIILWTCLFARTETGVVETVVPASFAATLACALVVPAFRGVAAAAIVAVLPLASGALLLLSKRALDLGVIPPANAEETREAGTVRRLNIVRMFLVIFAVYGMGCMLPAISLAGNSARTETAATILGMLFALAIAAGIVLFSRRINLEALFRWISAPFVFAVIATAFGTLLAAVASRVLMNAVFTGIEIIMVLYFVRLSQRTGRTSTWYVGIGECAAYGGVFAGYMAQPAVSGLIGGSPANAALVCLALVGAFTVVSLLVPRRDVVWMDAAEAMAKTAEGCAAANRIQARDDADADDVIAERRLAVARRFGLSNRETEVFLMLAQGRSRPYIRDALVLSKNTVATHIRHIYEKMGIHSQQELIDLAQDSERSVSS